MGSKDGALGSVFPQYGSSIRSRARSEHPQKDPMPMESGQLGFSPIRLALAAPNSQMLGIDMARDRDREGREGCEYA